MPDPNVWQNWNLKAFKGGVLDYLQVPTGESRLSWGKGKTIAILDTGWLGHDAEVGASIRELNLIDAPREGEYSGHGTAVAGLIGSKNPFAPGIAPGADILAIRVLDGNGEGNPFTLAEGIIQAVDDGADVINMSLGGYGNSEILQSAVNYAAERGVVLVAASGNDGYATVTYPAAYGNVIGVASVDAAGNRTPFSNYGSGVDVSAPGYEINALWDDDSYVYFTGTSPSAALVSGMAGRLLQSGVATNGSEVKQLILDYANDTGPPDFDPQYGAGILNADRLESIGKSGIYDVALADLYPATEESDGTAFPLYITVQNSWDPIIYPPRRWRFR